VIQTSGSRLAVTEVVETARPVGVTMRCELNSIHVPRNCVLEVTQLPEALETSEEAAAEVAKMVGLVRVTIRGEVKSIPVPRNCIRDSIVLWGTVHPKPK